MGKILGLVLAVVLISLVGLLLTMVLLRIELVNYPAPVFPALEEARGQTVVLVFIRGWCCGPSASKGGELDKLNQHLGWFERVGIKLIAATSIKEGDEDLLIGISEARNLNYPLVGLGSSKVEEYQVLNTITTETDPADFIIDKNGVVRVEHRGVHGNDWTPHWLLLILVKLTELLALLIP